MARRSPLELSLAEDWRERVINFLLSQPHLAADVVPNSAEYRAIERILKHAEAAEAVKHLVVASRGNEVLFGCVLARALGSCSMIQIHVQASRYITTSDAKNSKKVLAIAEMLVKGAPDKHLLWELAGRYKTEPPGNRINNEAILAALSLIRDVLENLTRKPNNPIGRPPDLYKYVLAVNLDCLFRNAFGKRRPVHGAIAGFMNATFDEESMTDDRVKKILSHHWLVELKKYKKDKTRQKSGRKRIKVVITP
ncbi:MAG: hypothetical protein ACYC37_03500 [Desulfobacteria bacterium]